MSRNSFAAREKIFLLLLTTTIVFSIITECHLACVAGVQRGGRGEVECGREARSLGARRERLP